MRVKIRDEGTIRNKAVYLALGFTMEGHKEVLGLWIEQTEGAKFWLRVMNEIKKDLIFFDESGGGVTFSGGEQLIQFEFL